MNWLDAIAFLLFVAGFWCIYTTSNQGETRGSVTVKLLCAVVLLCVGWKVEQAALDLEDSAVRMTFQEGMEQR